MVLAREQARAQAHAHTHTHTHTHTRSHAHTHTRTHTHTHIHTHAHTRSHIHTYTHTHTYTHARAHIALSSVNLVPTSYWMDEAAGKEFRAGQCYPDNWAAKSRLDYYCQKWEWDRWGSGRCRGRCGEAAG